MYRSQEGEKDMNKEDKRKIVVPFNLEQFKDVIERIKAEYHAGNLYLVGLFEIETLEYYYEKAKEYEEKTALDVGADIEYFIDKLFGNSKVPKQFLSEVDDDTARAYKILEDAICTLDKQGKK